MRVGRSSDGHVGQLLPEPEQPPDVIMHHADHTHTVGSYHHSRSSRVITVATRGQSGGAAQRNASGLAVTTWAAGVSLPPSPPLIGMKSRQDCLQGES